MVSPAVQALLPQVAELARAWDAATGGTVVRTGRGHLAVLAAVGTLVLAGARSAPAQRQFPAERVLEALLVWRLVDASGPP